MLLASAFSGCMSRTFVHPFDTIRTRVMVSTSRTTSIAKTARELVKTDGVRGLYRGFGISMVMQAPAIATFLTTYEWSKKNISKYTGKSEKSAWVHLGSGLMAETVSAVFWVPMEVIKQRAQVRQSGITASTSTTIVRDLLRNEGARTLFKGYGLTIGVFGPYSMIYFMCYERFKAEMAKWCQYANESHLHTLQFAMCASSAGAIAAACTTPLDVIKTRIQTQGDTHTMATKTMPRLYQNSWHALRTIVATEGAASMFKGMAARVLWITPGTAITMCTFEFLKAYFHLTV